MQLAGLHAQVLWGDYVQNMFSRYDEVEQFLHPRIINGDRRKTREDWKKAIANAHKVNMTTSLYVCIDHCPTCISSHQLQQSYGMGKTEIQAKVWYLTSVKHYPLYGSTFFYVIYKGFWAHPNNLILAVGLRGISFVNQKTKAVCLKTIFACAYIQYSFI